MNTTQCSPYLLRPPVPQPKFAPGQILQYSAFAATVAERELRDGHWRYRVDFHFPAIGPRRSIWLSEQFLSERGEP